MKTSKNLETAIKASLDAGKNIMSIYDSTFDVEYKSDKSPLTEADKKANVIINSYLTSTQIPIISEENRQINYVTRKKWNKCWIVDPLDGTKEFVKRNGEFTINIALIENKEPILGIIYIPVEKTLYIADVEQNIAIKSKLHSHDDHIEDILSNAIKIKPTHESEDLIRVVGSRSHMNQETLDYVEKIRNKRKKIEIVSKGSSLKFCLIAEGKADIYPRFAPTMEWDTAAGQAICNAVNIKVISQETNAPLLYNKESLLNPWFLVGNI